MLTTQVLSVFPEIFPMMSSDLHQHLVAPHDQAGRIASELPVEREKNKDARFYWSCFAMVFVMVLLLLAFREPSAIRKPSFVAEDGFAFFKQAYEEPFWLIVARPHAGYIQLIHRLIAEFASFAPLEHIPLIYSLTALLLATTTLTFFALPSFRSIIRSDALRAIVVLTLPFMPNADGLMRMCAVHWYLLFFLVLVTMMPIPKGLPTAVLLWMAAALSFWSQPVAIVCVPVLIYRVWCATPGMERGWWMALTGMAILYPLTARSDSALLALWHTPNVLLSLSRAICFRVFCFFCLGQSVSKLALADGWLVAMRLSICCLSLCAAVVLWSWQTRSPGTRRTLVLLSYYILLLPVPYILRVDIIPDFVGINDNTWLAHQRYFSVSVLLLCVLGGVAYQEFGARWKGNTAASLLLLCWLGLHTPSYALWDSQSHPGWPHFARKIRRAEARVRQTGVGERIAVQTNPYIFVIDVGKPPSSAPAEW